MSKRRLFRVMFIRPQDVKAGDELLPGSQAKKWEAELDTDETATLEQITKLEQRLKAIRDANRSAERTVLIQRPVK